MQSTHKGKARTARSPEMASRKRKTVPMPSDGRLKARLGGCEAGAALRGGELRGRRISLLRNSQHLCNGDVTEWAARKVSV